MDLRSWVYIAQVANDGSMQNPKTFQAIAEHNALSPLLMLPQEIKNRIYYLVCGGQKVRILQNDRYHNHVHGDDTVKLSHTTCVEHTSEEQVQKDFDTADAEKLDWDIAAVEDRHEDCHKPPSEQKQGYPKPNQLSLTLLRSCRQIYLEANMIHYSTNTFAINCNDILERFARARSQNKQNLAIRSLNLDVSITHGNSVDVWSDSISEAVLKRLRHVRRLHLTLRQLYCTCTVDICGHEGSEMTERQAKMFKKFSKLPLKEATLVIDDRTFLKNLSSRYSWNLCIAGRRNRSRIPRKTLEMSCLGTETKMGRDSK